MSPCNELAQNMQIPLVFKCRTPLTGDYAADKSKHFAHNIQFKTYKENTIINNSEIKRNLFVLEETLHAS